MSRKLKDKTPLYAVVGVEGCEIDVIAVYELRETAERCVAENNARTDAEPSVYWVAACNLVTGKWDK